MTKYDISYMENDPEYARFWALPQEEREEVFKLITIKKMINSEKEALERLKAIWIENDKEALEAYKILQDEIQQLRRWYTEWRNGYGKTIDYNIKAIKNTDIRIIVKHLIFNKEKTDKLVEDNKIILEKNRKLQEVVEKLTESLFD